MNILKNLKAHRSLICNRCESFSCIMQSASQFKHMLAHPTIKKIFVLHLKSKQTLILSDMGNAIAIDICCCFLFKKKYKNGTAHYK